MPTAQEHAAEADRPSYWLTRFLILRLLGLVYLFAFVSLARQVLPLIGSNGLTPIAQFLAAAESYHGSRWDGFKHYPSLFWFDASDSLLLRLAWLGVALSAPLIVGLYSRRPTAARAIVAIILSIGVTVATGSPAIAILAAFVIMIIPS